MPAGSVRGIDDVTAILNLLHRYAELIDDGDFRGVGELLADAEVSGPGMRPLRGAEAVAALYEATTRRHADGTPRTAHVITNPIVELDGDRATVRSRFLVVQATEAVPLQAIVAGRYLDEFERVDGRWRFASRHMDPRLLGRLDDHLHIEL